MTELGYGTHCVARVETSWPSSTPRRTCLATARWPPRFVHGDVQPRIVLVDDSETITALIDIEVAGGGYPTEEFALVGLEWDAPGFAL